MATVKTAQLVLTDTERNIRERDADAPANSPSQTPILFLPFDGVNRDLLYDMLNEGELPKLTDLLSGEGKKFPHAYFDESLLSTMPSSTMAAWTTVLTGVPPAEHGISGNEFFIREERRLGAPAPVSFNDSKPTIEIYTDSYMNELVKVPTVYEKMRAREPHILIWVAIHQLYSGADRLLFATSTVMAHALEEGLVKVAKTATLQGEKPDRRKFAMLDNDVVAKVEDALDDDDDPVPDVLTVYLSGTDLYAHVAEEGPDEARRSGHREAGGQAARARRPQRSLDRAHLGPRPHAGQARPKARIVDRRRGFPAGLDDQGGLPRTSVQREGRRRRRLRRRAVRRRGRGLRVPGGSLHVRGDQGRL
jgi:hypothetical protein